jgi:flagellar basal-body rod protein FlgB
MFESTYFMKTQNLLERGLNASMVKRKVLADNIANVDVPNFKRSEVTFEENLKRALESEKTEKMKEVPTKISDERHIQFFKPLDHNKVSPKTNIDYLTSMRADGNNVDIEKEMTDSAQIQMHYSLMVERLNQNTKMLNMVLKSV